MPAAERDVGESVPGRRALGGSGHLGNAPVCAPVLGGSGHLGNAAVCAPVLGGSGHLGNAVVRAPVLGGSGHIGNAVVRALVLGGSGHIGNAVVRALLAAGHAITVARRGRTRAENLTGLPVAHALGDVDQPDAADAWVAGHVLVVDAAAPYPWTLAERDAAEIAARRAERLVAATARHGARLIHIGSFVTALGTDDAGLPREPGARLDGALHPYFAAKRAGEAVFAAAARAGAPITIVHPTTCLGPWDSRPPRHCLVPSVLAGRMPVVPAHVINVVDVRDVARAVVAAAARPPDATPIRLTGHNVGIPELCGLIGELAGAPVTTRSIPAGAARAAAWLIELSTAGAVQPPLLLPTLLALRQTPLTVGPAQRALGAAPRPLSATLRDAIAWYRGPSHDNGL